MAPNLSHIAAMVAGGAICATAFVVIPRSPLKGVAIAVLLCIVAALLIAAIRTFC